MPLPVRVRTRLPGGGQNLDPMVASNPANGDTRCLAVGSANAARIDGFWGSAGSHDRG